MKLPAVVLTASIAGNLALGTWLALHPRGDASAPALTAASTSVATSARSSTAAGAAATTASAAHLLALEPAALRDHLRTLALPPDVIEHLVAARINAPLAARRRELLAEAWKNQPPWKQTDARFNPLSILTPAQRKELRDLEAAARAETARLLGPAYLDRDGAIAFKYAFVPLAKAVQLDALDRDYDTFNEELREETRILKTAADREREKLLITEQERDLAALLTPAERDAWEMRLSPTARNSSFQQHIAAFAPTENEYRALYALRKKGEATIVSTAPGTTSGVTVPPIAGATMMMVMGGPSAFDEAAVRAALGETRFAEWQLAGQGHYQALVRLAATENLAPGVVKQVSDVLAQTSNRSWEIAENTATTVDQKKAALAALAAETRSQVIAQLGAERAQNYLSSTRWFNGIATGTAVKLSDRTIAMRSVDAQDRVTVSSSSSSTTTSPGGTTVTNTTTSTTTVPIREPGTPPTK